MDDNEQQSGARNALYLLLCAFGGAVLYLFAMGGGT